MIFVSIFCSTGKGILVFKASSKILNSIDEFFFYIFNKTQEEKGNEF
jgi:hypothetical protein